MATVQVAFSGGMRGYPTPDANPSSSETFTSSGTSQASTAAAEGGDIVSITSVGGDVWACIGQSPTAASNTEWLIASGSTRAFGPLAAGDKVAIIDA